MKNAVQPQRLNCNRKFFNHTHGTASRSTAAVAVGPCGCGFAVQPLAIPSCNVATFCFAIYRVLYMMQTWKGTKIFKY